MNKKLILTLIGLFILLFIASFGIKKLTQKEKELTPMQVLELPGQAQEEYFYNGYAFAKIGGLWYTQLQAPTRIYSLVLHYGPKEIEDIPIMGAHQPGFFESDKIYVTFDPEGEDLGYVALSITELTLSIARVWDVTPVAACSENKTEDCMTRPIINCTNTDKPVIYVKQGPINQTLVLDNCVLITGTGLGIVQSAEKYLYSIYQVIKFDTK